MNKELMTRVRDVLLQEATYGNGFTQALPELKNPQLDGATYCETDERGTRFCIAGLVVLLAAPPEERIKVVSDGSFGVHDEAQTLLGITEDESDSLFLLHPLMRDLRPIHAYRVVKHLMETGVVDWSKAE